MKNCSLGNAEGSARQTVNEVLKDADWIRWASLNDLLPLLAEAAPKEFLENVDTALETTPCPFDILFAQENSNGIGRANFMTGLLWSLELLAWDPEYLTHVVITLGELSKRDPGGNRGNRPSHSLNTIFLPWLPQTCATIEQRKITIETLIRENPKIAWNLLLSLLPQSVTVSSGSYRPRWRESIPDTYSKRVTYPDYWKQISIYAELALGMAKKDMKNLTDLIENFSNLPKTVQDPLLKYLVSDSIMTLSEFEKLPIWTELVHFINKHRKYANSEWAMKREDIDRIATVADFLAPNEPFYRHQRLFNERSFDLFEDKGDFAQQNKKLEKARLSAITEILKNRGNLPY